MNRFPLASLVVVALGLVVGAASADPLAAVRVNAARPGPTPHVTLAPVRPTFVLPRPAATVPQAPRTITPAAARADVRAAIAQAMGRAPEPGLRIVLLKVGPTEAKFVAYRQSSMNTGSLIAYPFVGKVDMAKDARPAGVARVSQVDNLYVLRRSELKGPRF